MTKFQKISIILLFSTCYFLFSHICQAATLYLKPASAEYRLNEIFTTEIRVDNENESLNAFEIYLGYPTEFLEVVDVNLSNSILGPVVDSPKIDKEKGVIFFSGIVPGGYNGRITGDPGESNLLAKVIFIVQGEQPISSEQLTKINFQDNCLILLNDGLATKATLKTKGANIKILPQSVDQENSSLPENDNTPPEFFQPEITRYQNIFNNQWFIVFFAEDTGSGIDYYQLAERPGRKTENYSVLDWQKAESPYLLNDQDLLSYIYLKAVDKTGNGKVIIINPQNQVERKWIWYIIILSILIIFFFIFKAIFKSLRKNERAQKQKNIS